MFSGARSFVGVTIALGVLVTVAGCGGADEASDQSVSPSGRTDCVSTGVTEHKDLQYADAPKGVSPWYLRLDLTVPTLDAGCAPPPVVLYVHGDSLANGDKGSESSGFLRSYVTGHGWAFAAINYQLVGDSAGLLTNSYPTQTENVISAIGWLGRNGAAKHVNGDRVAVVGSFGGGLLAAQVGAGSLPGGQVPQSVRCTATFTVLGYDISALVGKPVSAWWQPSMQTAFPDSSTWDAASPLDRVLTSASPLRWLLVIPQSPPYIENAQDFGRNIGAGGGLQDLVTFTPVDGVPIEKRVGQPDETEVTPAFTDFLKQCSTA